MRMDSLGATFQGKVVGITCGEDFGDLNAMTPILAEIDLRGVWTCTSHHWCASRLRNFRRSGSGGQLVSDCTSRGNNVSFFDFIGQRASCIMILGNQQ